jgi:hypothetical protein
MTTEGQGAEINPIVVRALGLPSLAAESVATKLAEIGGLRTPTRPETVKFLVATLERAASEIPTGPAAWSWGEFHHAGLFPAHELIQSNDLVRLAICASDLGLADESCVGPTDTPRQALSRNLVAATETLLQRLRERLEAAGISTYGHEGVR